MVSKLAQCGLDKASAGRTGGGGGGGKCSLDEQEEVFRQQLALAKQMSRPITVRASQKPPPVNGMYLRLARPLSGYAGTGSSKEGQHDHEVDAAV